jgi:hypothetical protein
MEAVMAKTVDPLILARFLGGHDQAARRRGIEISIGDDFAEYVSITRATPSKGPTYPNFRPDRSPIAPGMGFWMKGVEPGGRVVLLQAVRLYDLAASSFAEHLQSLKAFYEDPSRHASPGDVCVCSAPSARSFTGRVAYHGDLWVSADHRGCGMPTVMAGIAFGVSLALWSPDWICALVPRWLLDKGVVAQYGYRHYEHGGSILSMPEERIVDDDWLIWLTGAELVEHVGQGGDSGLRESAPRDRRDGALQPTWAEPALAHAT